LAGFFACAVVGTAIAARAAEAATIVNRRCILFSFCGCRDVLETEETGHA
jgi:hypothetical protein